MRICVLKSGALVGASIGIGLTILVLCFVQGCSPLEHTRIVQDTTLVRADSPYNASIKVVSKQETDTTTTRLSDTTDVEVTRRTTCLYQEVVLTVRSQVQTQPHVAYLRARDNDCQTPGAVRWETLQLRGKTDQRRWDRSAELRETTKQWLTTYLTQMYSLFPELN